MRSPHCVNVRIICVVRRHIQLKHQLSSIFTLQLWHFVLSTAMQLSKLEFKGTFASLPWGTKPWVVSCVRQSQTVGLRMMFAVFDFIMVEGLLCSVRFLLFIRCGTESWQMFLFFISWRELVSKSDQVLSFFCRLRRPQRFVILVDLVELHHFLPAQGPTLFIVFRIFRPWQGSKRISRCLVRTV